MAHLRSSFSSPSKAPPDSTFLDHSDQDFWKLLCNSLNELSLISSLNRFEKPGETVIVSIQRISLLLLLTLSTTAFALLATITTTEGLSPRRADDYPWIGEFAASDSPITNKALRDPHSDSNFNGQRHRQRRSATQDRQGQLRRLESRGLATQRQRHRDILWHRLPQRRRLSHIRAAGPRRQSVIPRR